MKGLFTLDTAQVLLIERSNLLVNDCDAQVRQILAYATVALMFIALVAYIITGNVAMIGAGTILGLATKAVFRYYFTREK